MEGGELNLGPVAIKQLFTAGNILEDSFKVEYLRSEERRPFKAVVRFRHETKNKFPQEKVIEVKLLNQLTKHGLERLTQEQFDLTQFCTSKRHAIQVAKYFLGIRDLVTHTISFSTTVHGLVF
jgi:predicted phage tail protein